MADKIPANAPRGPQHRKQVMDEHGNFHPVPDDRPEPPGEAPPPERPHTVGDHVTLSGRVLEVQATQGGKVSVRVQLGDGVAWFQGQHLERVTAPAPDGRVAALEARADEETKRADAAEAKLREVEKQMATAAATLADNAVEIAQLKDAAKGLPERKVQDWTSAAHDKK